MLILTSVILYRHTYTCLIVASQSFYGWQYRNDSYCAGVSRISGGYISACHWNYYLLWHQHWGYLISILIQLTLAYSISLRLSVRTHLSKLKYTQVCWLKQWDKMLDKHSPIHKHKLLAGCLLVSTIQCNLTTSVAVVKSLSFLYLVIVFKSGKKFLFSLVIVLEYEHQIL